MNKKELERIISLSQKHYMKENPNYELMFPEGWDDDSKWPRFEYDYDSFKSTQIEIDDYMERMAGC